MYAINYTYVSTRAVYLMHHTELLTVYPLIRPAEGTPEGNHCITVFVVNQDEGRWRVLPVGLSKTKITEIGVQNTPARVVKC
jgi:hypothetical protein